MLLISVCYRLLNHRHQLPTSNLTSEEPDTELTPNNSRQPIFYESDEWEQFVDHALANVTVPQPPSLRVQGQQQECQQQHPKQPHCQDQGVNHQAQQANQNINITSVNSAGSKFLFFHSLFRRLL